MFKKCMFLTIGLIYFSNQISNSSDNAIEMGTRVYYCKETNVIVAEYTQDGLRTSVIKNIVSGKVNFYADANDGRPRYLAAINPDLAVISRLEQCIAELESTIV